MEQTRNKLTFIIQKADSLADIAGGLKQTTMRPKQRSH